MKFRIIPPNELIPWWSVEKYNSSSGGWGFLDAFRTRLLARSFIKEKLKEYKSNKFKAKEDYLKKTRSAEYYE